MYILVEVKNGYFVILCLNEITHYSPLLCIHLKPISWGTYSIFNWKKAWCKYVANRKIDIYMRIGLVVSKCLNWFFLFSEPPWSFLSSWSMYVCVYVLYMQEYSAHIDDVLIFCFL